MRTLVEYINEEYKTLKDDIDVSDLVKRTSSQVYMIYYDVDMIVDVVSYDDETDITGDDEHTTDKFTHDLWTLQVGQSMTYDKNIYTRIK